jgi:hypothetical protein
LFSDLKISTLDVKNSTNFASNINLTDDQLLEFGNLPDFSIRYDSTDDELKIEDEENNVVKQRWDKNGDSFFDNGDVHFPNYLITQAGQKLRPADRKKITTENKVVDPTPLDTTTVSIGGTDYEFWVPDVPEVLAHQIEYDIPDGDYSNVHIFVPDFTEGDIHIDNGIESQGAPQVIINGNGSTPTNVKFASFHSVGAQGGVACLRVKGINFVDADPASDEDPAMIFYGGQTPSVNSCSFEGNTPASTGIISYCSEISVESNTDLGSSDLSTGINTKHGGEVDIQNNGVKGTVTGSIVENNAAGVVSIEDNSASGSSIIGNNQGFIADVDNGEFDTAGINATGGSGIEFNKVQDMQMYSGFDTTNSIRLDGNTSDISNKNSNRELNLIQEESPPLSLENTSTGQDDVKIQFKTEDSADNKSIRFTIGGGEDETSIGVRDADMDFKQSNDIIDVNNINLYSDADSTNGIKIDGDASKIENVNSNRQFNIIHNGAQEFELGNRNDGPIFLTTNNSSSTKVDRLKISGGSDTATIDVAQSELRFPDITGQPKFNTHDHSEGGMTAIPNAGLSNSQVTFAGQTASLGGSVSIATTNLSDQNISTPSAGQTILYDATNSEFVNAEITAGTALGKSTGDGSFTLNVQEGSINHDNLSGFVSNEHIDHSSVTVTGTGALTGGGDLTASRTIDVATDGIGTDELDESANFNFSGDVEVTGTFGGNGSQLTFTDNYGGDVQAVANNYTHSDGRTVMEIKPGNSTNSYEFRDSNNDPTFEVNLADTENRSHYDMDFRQSNKIFDVTKAEFFSSADSTNSLTINGNVSRIRNNNANRQFNISQNTNEVFEITNDGGGQIVFSTNDSGGNKTDRMFIDPGDTPALGIDRANLNMNSNQVNNVDQFGSQTIKSTEPSSPSAGDWYIDDGSNTSSGNLAIRIYNGTNWIDQN